MLVPNRGRVLIRPVLIDELKSSGIVVAGQLKAGENLLYGTISAVATDSAFVIGQRVFYSEYSAANLIDYRPVADGSKKFSEVQKEGLVVVAEDDIMAYDPTEVSETAN